MSRKNLIHTSVGIELVRKLAEAGDRIFTVERARELAPSVGLSSGYLLQALHHLAKSGWVSRLRNGLYSLSSSVPGVSPLHEFEMAMAMVNPAAISHWSALNYHGLTEQIPRWVFVTTTAKSVPRQRRAKSSRSEKGYPVGGMVYQFIQVKPERFFGIEEVWVNEARVKMTDPERTLLDGLLAPRYCGGFTEIFHIFTVLGTRLDLDRIIEYALKLDLAAIKRLGWVLEHQGIDPARLERLRTVPIKGYRALDPTGPRRGPCDQRWMIQVNLLVKVKV